MRLQHVTDNGNIAALNRHEVSSHINYDNRLWLSNNTDSRNEYNNITRTDNSQYNTNFNIYDTRESSDVDRTIENSTSNITEVYNRQYRLNTETNVNFIKSCVNTANLEGVTETIVAQRENFLGDTNVSLNSTPIDEERAFEQSDTDEMSERGIHPVPRGIVNPNYPGFQHLAHTLQDYSANIENFYHSENEMTDDDVDLEITESAYEPEFNQNVISIDSLNIDNNNGNETEHTILCTQKELSSQNKDLDSPMQIEIPDLLKSVSQNNNNVNHTDFDLNCSETDIENNFHTKDIIGDFNKEIEDEIRELLNYNINIQDDLEELRKDIKDTFAKPIETTINNISEVVNHVIKKLVKTQIDPLEQNDNQSSTNTNQEIEEIKDVNEENETNTRTEMNLNRPTFLLIGNNTDGNIADAFLSDGKDEINVNEYDTEALSNNVERTIKQLSTELRKIIPKLDEMRECDRLWNESKKDTIAVLTDGNSNEIANSSKNYNLSAPVNKEYEECRKSAYHVADKVVRKVAVATRIEPRAPRDRQKDITSTKSSYRSAQSNTSVRKSESAKEYDLGSFDVYNIETALPKLDIDAIENHLKAAKEAERRKRNDREEIRKRLAMGAESEEYYSMGHIDRPGRKPSLHSRLQNGAKLRPTSFTSKTPKSRSAHSLGHIELKESDFYALQATLQTEARIALAQAKEMARIQMERERRARAVSPVTEMLRRSMEKANAPLAADRRRVSRQLLTDMNIAQLQVIVNELHSQIESLNEQLVKMLMARDELHMGQDSMLVDIEDLTRYLGVKEQTKKTKGNGKSGVRRLASLVHK
ncbi:schwannomin-interacting protein 1 homolog isoform X3 [Pectinophora gossypiella]|uniref:schwannomin-interacting protein 1 homolog isoform X3 n=1 Tax=Pectinophora gossypiella TaxID=13191 RepID=UPI00214E9969|nr:schwannomin-interacting protein 1 homolog isoform X3 [Pectinophora gossypiella]